MTQPTTDLLLWTTADLERLPESSDRYEIVDGELLVIGVIRMPLLTP
ncbi:hypothetical protein ACN4EG_22840 [Alkalinema pantanalense CENA528]